MLRAIFSYSCWSLFFSRVLSAFRPLLDGGYSNTEINSDFKAKIAGGPHGDSEGIIHPSTDNNYII